MRACGGLGLAADPRACGCTAARKSGNSAMPFVSVSRLRALARITHQVAGDIIKEPFAKFGSALGQPWVSPWERGRPARILVKALPRRQSAGEPTNPVKPIATTLPSLVRAGRPRSQGSQPFPAINPTYWRILQKAQKTVYFQHLIGPVLRAYGNRLRWACPGLSFSLQRAHAPSPVVTATLFAREHALKEKIRRHDHAPW